MSGSFSGITSLVNSPEQIQTLEKELASLKAELLVITYSNNNNNKSTVGMLAYECSFMIKTLARVTTEAARAATISGGAGPNIYAHVPKAGVGRKACGYVKNRIRYHPHNLFCQPSF